MTYTDTYRQTAAECLAAEFVTVYSRSGAGKIHASTCPNRRVRGSQIRTATSPGAIRNGCADMATCCADHESRLFWLARQMDLF